VEIFKEGNVNYIRTSHYPPSEMLLEACDELGMFVEEEAPFCWAKKDYVNDGNYFQAILQPTLEMIERDKSHPSIIQWSLANESFDYFELFKISADFVKEADPSRPRIFSQWNPNSDNGNLELGNHHYPGPEGAIKYKDMERPIVFDEYCHLNAYNRFELMTDPGVRDFWGEDFKTMWEKMFRTRAVLGGALWAGIDDSFFLPSGHVVGYGTWGPIDGWRRKKPEFWHMKKVYSPVKVELLGMEENEPVRLKLDNRYLFTNLEECTIKWQNGNRNGVLQPSCEPGKSIEVSLPLKGAELDTLYIDIYKEGPVPVDQYLFNFSKPNVEWKEEHNLSFKKSNPGKKQVVESDKIRIELSENGIHITDINGDKILSGFPELMLVPLTGRGGGTQMTKDIPEIELFSPVGKNRRIEDISVKNSDSELVILINDSYDEAIGEMKWIINPDGKTKITYNYRILEELNLRQWGVSFCLSDHFKTLNWKRKGIWSVYPKNHIGRNEGNAILYSGNTNCGLAGPEEKPTWEWKDDQTQYGTNDFRSTKRNIFYATLLNDDGKGVKVSSSGLQHVRAWFANDNIHLLVAEYDNPGAEGYFNSHSNHWNRPLKKGDRIIGSINFDMAFTLAFD
jgi:hypothetical protein